MKAIHYVYTDEDKIIFSKGEILILQENIFQPCNGKLKEYPETKTQTSNAFEVTCKKCLKFIKEDKTSKFLSHYSAVIFECECKNSGINFKKLKCSFKQMCKIVNILSDYSLLDYQTFLKEKENSK